MRIGIDIDDTVSKTNACIRQYAFQYDKNVLKGKGYRDKDAFYFKDMFYWTDEDINSFMDLVRTGDLFIDLTPVEDSVSYINKLYDEGNEIYFITRRKNTENMLKVTKTWLSNNKYKYHKLIMGMDEKGNICKIENIDLFIDNDIRHVNEVLNQGIDAILMADDYNSDVTGVKRVLSWKEAYDYITR